MRVLSVAFSPNGGITTVLDNLTVAMRNAGHVYESIDADAVVRDLGSAATRELSFHAALATSSLTGSLVAREMDDVLPSADVVHCHDFRAAPLARALADRRRIPMVLTVHYWFTAPQWREGSAGDASELAFIDFRVWLQSWAVHAADRVTAVSEYTAETVRSAVDPVPDIKVITNCAPTAGVTRFSGNEKRTVFLPARLTRGKGVDIAIRAIAEIDSSADLVIAGDGPRRVELETLAALLGVEDRVRFLGDQPLEVLSTWMAVSMCTVIPSRWDWFPITVLEAQSSGAVVLASDAGGIPEQIRLEHDGLLFASEDVSDLGAQLRWLLSDEARGARDALRAGALSTSSIRPGWDAAAHLYQREFAAAAAADRASTPV